MNQATTRRYTGRAGIIAGLCVLVSVPLYFLYPGAPPDWNILTRSLITITGCVVFIVFFTGLRHVIQQADPGQDWLATIIQAAGLIWVVMTLIPQAMESGSAISTSHPIDTTTEGPFAAAQYLMQGGISRLLQALLLFALGMVAARLTAWPTWVPSTAYLLAMINLAFVPAMYFGDDAAFFYSAQGWGTTATMGALWSIWTLALGISILRIHRREGRSKIAAQHTAPTQLPT